MNKINKLEINSCLKSIPDSLDFPIVLVDHLLKTKEEYKNLKKQEIQDTFIKGN